MTAGFVTVLVGFTSSAAIVFQAARAGGASPPEVASWLEALGIGMAATSIGLSLRYRAPIVTAWSTPGAALLVTSLVGVRLPEAIGAFMFSAVLIVAAGASGAFERAITRIPLPIAQALLAGVLVRFGLGVFTAVRVAPGLVLSMFVVFVVARRWLPRYTMVFVLLVGVVLAVGDGSLRLGAVHVLVTSPRFVAPAFSVATMVSVGIPLFLVTMASQNLPGVAVLRSAGYRTPISPLITATGLTTLVLAPFGAFAINLAAITAAICAGPEAHEDPTRRYMASVAAGGFYLVVGVFGATVAALFAAFPAVLVAAVAGLALIPTIAASLAGALADERVREPAVITFLVTASGVTLGGIGSAFWGALAGLAVLGVFAVGRDARPPRSAAVARPAPGSAAGLDSAAVARTRPAPEEGPANDRLPDGPAPLDGDLPAPAPPPGGPKRRRATMSGSRLSGLVGAGLGAAVGGILGSSVWIFAVVGFIVLAELPDLVYRVRARRGHTDPLLPPWSASEAYLVTLRRWRRSRSDLSD